MTGVKACGLFEVTPEQDDRESKEDLANDQHEDFVKYRLEVIFTRLW